MKKTVNALRVGLALTGITLAILVFSSVVAPMAHAAFVSPMGVGSSGGNVTQLQQFLGTNYQIYPSDIVSGYFGPLTQAGVVQFQVAYGIPQVGEVGPITAAKMNNIMATGFGLDTTAPTMSALSVSQVNPDSAVVSWNTNELARGQVFYDTNPIQSNEATGHYQLPYVSGVTSNANSNTSVGNSQSIELTGLQPNTFYYYVARAIDQSGNVSMSMTQSFQTN